MNKILSIIAIFSFSCLPPEIVLSQEIAGGSYTGAAFLEKAKNNQITLMGNVTVTTTIEVNSKLTIDLNGYVLKGDLSSNGYVLAINQRGDLTIKDSNKDSATPIAHRGRLDSKGLFIWPANTTETFLKSINGGIIVNAFKGEEISSRGILVEGKCIIEYAKIMGCYAKGNGAAITVTTTGSFTMNDGEISYNYSTESGGGIYGYNININGGLIKNNQAKNGGGIYLYSDTNDCNIQNCTIESNYATTFGGGIYSATPTSILNSRIIKNRAMVSEIKGASTSTNLGRGGGFCFIGAGANGEERIFRITNTIVSENACMYYGGGGHIASNAYLILEGENSQISKNEAILGGAGGLHVTSSATFEFVSGAISDNKADSYGGGIHSSYECNLILTGGVISNNTVTGRGGGVHVNTGGSLDLKGTIIEKNKAYKTYDYKYCEVTFNQNDATYSWNPPTAVESVYQADTGYGGGITIDAGTCTMYKGNLSSNEAEVGGGGIALVMINTSSSRPEQLKVGQFTLYDGIVSNNKTNGNGAGIYLMKNMMSDKDVDQSIKDATPQITIKGGSVIDNSSVGNGGGIYQEDKTKFTIDGNAVFSNNESINGSGGAVYIAQGEAEIFGGIIKGNNAKVNGGALYINGKITVNNGAINDNHATNGGGICVEAGEDLIFEKCNITKNSADSYGGGIYVANEHTGVTISLKGGSVFENNSASIAGGGLAVNGPITFKFSGSIQNNKAKNGGGIYLANTAKLDFIGGFIRSNVANGEDANISTGYWSVADNASGFGGGVYLDSGTTLNFPLSSTTNFGFYGNEANIGGDDIFANGNQTTVILPDISGMTLSDFNVPTSELYWVEDYVIQDTQYAKGTVIIKDPQYTPNRYKNALRMADRICILDKTAYNTYTDKYLCLALGYELYYIELQKQGLKAGDTAIFKIYYGDQKTLYRELILVGKGENETISIVIVLPPNTWYFEEDDRWTWKYHSDQKTIFREVKTHDDVKEPIKFTNNYRNDISESEKVHTEIYKENRMRCK